ncbi:D-alanyl-D-alanine carboxypeptidase family protein [Demequina sp. NBRC 110051]|uniref:D-alanyl-D-alanine carboxypeptidase family protein n=1 Tax=Demequina sp. NBRC 110051 TaxID=1570340 RepID=UPI0009FF31D9|nr:D-alanyl-D-alanine carboxypeptidase family protein [Demequina sp. NBRC 110051]
MSQAVMSVRAVAAAVVALVALIGAPATPATAATEGFRDVTGRHQFYREISWLTERGITTGYADNSFRPSGEVSREAFAAFLYRLAGRPGVSVPSRSPFKDVSTNAQFYREIVWLEKQHITTGWADGTFRPKDAISRSAMAAFLYRYKGSPSYTPPSTSRFTDTRTSSTFYTEVSWLASTGMTTGYADGTFRPYDGTSRAATAAFLFRGFGNASYHAPTYAPPTTWHTDRDYTRIINDPESVLVVVNKRRALDPLRYAPADLVTLSGISGGSTRYMRREAATAMSRMHAAVRAKGMTFSIVSAYRSHDYQRALFARYARQHGVASAETFSARAGHSEHQTGWTADLGAGTCSLGGCFGSSTVGRWVAAHSHEYGFIIRYPQGAQAITGYIYEPWHVRYVGVELATYMHDHDIDTLEEQFGLPAAPDYR